eukprot:1009428_1
MDDPPIDIPTSREATATFNNKIYEIFQKTRPDHNTCIKRYNVLTLVNEIWQSYLIEQIQNQMINKSNRKYSSIITPKTSIEIETIETEHTKPYKKQIITQSKSPTKSHASQSISNINSIWCTPTIAAQKVIIIREYENGPIIKKIIIPPVVIFGSIAFGLDGSGSDIDLALPAGVYTQSVNAHLDTSKQVKLLREFETRFQLNINKSKCLGFKWKIEPILHARVPIIKLEDINDGLLVDISIRSTQLPTAMLINKYCSYNPIVRTFYMFIKQWSKSRKISDAIYGFPNSFGFVMLATKFLQLLPEPLIPIFDYNEKKKKIIELHSIKKFKKNTMTLLELAVSFFDYYYNFDFETYQISITSAGLQWKHAKDYNLMHKDQSTMLIEDPSAKNENVTRCLKPYNLKIIREELFRAYKCAKNGNWELLLRAYDENNGQSIFEIYPPIDEIEEAIRYEMEDYDEFGSYNDEMVVIYKQKHMKKKNTQNKNNNNL